MTFRDRTEDLIHEIANKIDAHGFNTYKLYLMWNNISNCADNAEEMGDVGDRAAAAYEELNFLFDEERWDMSLDEYTILYEMIRQEEGEE